MKRKLSAAVMLVMMFLFSFGNNAVYSADKPEDSRHGNWYWQMDNDSKEYKEYMERIESERKQLRGQIYASGISVNDHAQGDTNAQGLPAFTPQVNFTGPVAQNGEINTLIASDESSKRFGPAPVSGTETQHLPAFTPVVNKKGPTPMNN